MSTLQSVDIRQHVFFALQLQLAGIFAQRQDRSDIITSPLARAIELGTTNHNVPTNFQRQRMKQTIDTIYMVAQWFKTRPYDLEVRVPARRQISL